MSSTQDYSKQTRLVQNFFTKSAQVIAEARLAADELKGGGSAGLSGPGGSGSDDASAPPGSINKWFNLELRELEFMAEDLKPWRQVPVGEQVPPLVVECYLDPSRLRPGQTVVLADSGSSTNQEVVLERWVVECKPLTDAIVPEDLPVIYKRAIVSMRSLYTASRLLPAWQLHQKLTRQKLTSLPLRLGIRIHNGSMPISSRGRVGLSKPIGNKRSNLQQFQLQPLVTPVGTLFCGVTYRADVNFGVEDIEKVMAQRFIELDAPQGSMSSLHPVGSQGSHTSTQGSLSQKPILSFTRPFRSPDAGSSQPHLIPQGSHGPHGIAPQSIAGSASSAISTSSRFSSSFASHRTPSHAPRSFSIESQQRAASVHSQATHGSQHSQPSPTAGLDPGSEMYMTQSDVGDFVKFVDDARKNVADRIGAGASDPESSLARYQTMRASYIQLSESIMQGSATASATASGSVTPETTLRPEKRRSSGPRSRLGFYSEHEDDEIDNEMLFALSDMHI